MADITARLVWYKITEKYTDVCEKYERFLDWYEDFSWSRVDFLDMLFLGWLLVAFLVVGAIHLYLRFFGHPKSKKGITSGDDISAKNGEGLEWLNSALSWLFHHYNNTPEFVEAWIRALNDQARKQQFEYDIKVDGIQSGSPPPKLKYVATESSNKDYLTIQAGVESEGETTLLVSAIQKSATSIRVTNCDVAILKLKGQLTTKLKVNSSYSSNKQEISINLCFASSPEINLQVRPRQIDSKIKLKTVEDAVKNIICSSVTSVTLPCTGGYPDFYPPGIIGEANSTLQHQGLLSAVSADGSLLQAASPGGTLKNRRLLVKVIKANGLGDKDFACSGPYCTVQADEPKQRHITSVVKNTVNPFWDEHFVFDLNDDTKNFKFEVYDREKTPGSDFLGRATIAMNELKRLPSSRQIIPLTGKPGSTTTSGSVTVEFLFMEATESSQPFASVNKLEMDGISPRRRVETNKTMTPGGTLITTSTTTTERPRERIDASFNESLQHSPNRVEKSDTSSNYTGEYSPYSSRSSSHLGAHEAGLTASQQGSNANRTTNLGSPSFTVTPSEHNYLTPDPTDLHNDYDRSISPSDTSDRSRAVPQMASPSQSDGSDEVKKSKSFASTLKRKFQRNKDKSKRSQSADRASSYRDDSLLRPPGQHSSTAGANRLSDDIGRTDIPEAGLQKNRERSRSFSSSLKKLFKGKKKDGVSRESSVSKQSTRSAQGALTISRESSLQPSPQIYHHPQQSSSSPTAGSPDFPYSSSVPVQASPLYDQYTPH